MLGQAGEGARPSNRDRLDGLLADEGIGGPPGKGQAMKGHAMKTTRHVIPVLAALACAGFLPACTMEGRLEAVPEGVSFEAQIPGIPDARYWPDDPASMQRFMEDGIASFHRELEYRASIGDTSPLPPAAYLAVSGGGDNGAYGAGLLVGWTAAGTRPAFKAVTGISTGALTAPFAFLGPDYDDELRTVYTTITADDVFTPRGIWAALMEDAMADTTPLWGLVSKFANQDMLDAVAAEYRKGRLLMIGTTDLDARRPVIWNMGAIAASGSPNALELFRSVLIASAAIPGAFPPVMIDVEAGGRRYQEMHVDGGTSAQVFLYPSAFNLAKVTEEANVTRERHVYIIRNARLDPNWASVERSTLSIAGRAISSLIQTQGIGDLYTIYLLTQRDGLDYNLAFIPAAFDMQPAGEFDRNFMTALFDYGYAEAKAGYDWHKTPPGLAE